MPTWFKLLLAWLVGLLLLLLWLNSIENKAKQPQVAIAEDSSVPAQPMGKSSPKEAVIPARTPPPAAKARPAPTFLPAEPDTPHQATINQVIQPLLQAEPTLTFEDKLPEPVPHPSFQSQPQQTSALPTHSPYRKKIALLIDDVGYDLRALKRLLALPFPITVAILPDAPHALAAAKMAYDAGIPIMLHMPMQTSNPKYQQKMERYYLHDKMSKATFNSVFEAALAKIPHVEGINNHMGSSLTSNRKYMQWLMELCKKHHLYFIDSKTAATSVGAKEANKAGIAWNQRDIFLDHKVDLASLQHAWKAAVSFPRKNRNCIIIGHPHAETVNFLENNAQSITLQGLTGVSSLLHHAK